MMRLFSVFLAASLKMQFIKRPRCRWCETSARSCDSTDFKDDRSKRIMATRCHQSVRHTYFIFLFQMMWFIMNQTCHGVSKLAIYGIRPIHYNGVIMSAMASQIIGLAIIYSIVYSRSKKHQRSAWEAVVRGIHRWPVNSPQKGPVTRKMFPFDDVIIFNLFCALWYIWQK